MQGCLFGVWALFLIPPFLPCYIYVLGECFGEFSVVCFFPIALKEFLVNILYVSSGVVFYVFSSFMVACHVLYLVIKSEFHLRGLESFICDLR